MALNIKNEETCNLARELADLTGETMTGAITIALRERLDRERDIQNRLQKMREIRDRIAPHLRDGPSAVDHGDWLYDEHGLPK